MLKVKNFDLHCPSGRCQNKEDFLLAAARGRTGQYKGVYIQKVLVANDPAMNK